MKKLSTREKVIAAITFVMLFVYAIVFLVARPLNNMLATMQESIATSEKRLMKGREILSSRAGLQESLDKLENEWGVSASDNAEATELVAALEAAATAADIRINNIEPRPVIKDVLIRYPIALTVSGTSTGIIKFLHIIQVKPLALRVDNLNLERAVDGNTVINGSIVVTRLRIIR